MRRVVPRIITNLSEEEKELVIDLGLQLLISKYMCMKSDAFWSTVIEGSEYNDSSRFGASLLYCGLKLELQRFTEIVSQYIFWRYPYRIVRSGHDTLTIQH